MKRLSLLVAPVLLVVLVFSPVVIEAADVVLNVAMEAGRMSDAAQSVVPEFEAKHPGVRVNIIPIPYTQYTQRVTTEIASGGGAYDVVESHFLMNAQYIPSGFLYALDDYIEKYNVDLDDFVVSAIAPGTLAGNAQDVSPDGKSIYGLPYNSDVLMMVYRQDLYEKYGLNYPENWEEAYEAMKLIKEKRIFTGMSLVELVTLRHT